MESPSLTKESCCDQVCGRDVPAWRPREAIVWSCEAGSPWRPEDVQDAGVTGYLPRSAADREWDQLCRRSGLQSTKLKGAGDLKRILASDTEMQSLEISPLLFSLDF